MLKRKVLLLNHNYEPMGIISAKKAVILYYMQKVEIVERHDVNLYSVHFVIPLPSVIRLLYFVRIPFKRVDLTRHNILRRDGYRCQYCGTSKTPLTIDHVIPKTKGGQDTWENLVCACVKCNNKKGNRSPEQMNMALLTQPKRPNHLFFIQRFAHANESSWKPYLFIN